MPASGPDLAAMVTITAHVTLSRASLDCCNWPSAHDWKFALCTASNCVECLLPRNSIASTSRC
jgi:hypothetical protein